MKIAQTALTKNYILVCESGLHCGSLCYHPAILNVPFIARETALTLRLPSLSLLFAALGGFAMPPVAAAAADSPSTLVHTQAQYRVAVQAAHAGSKIVLADGEWRDFRIELRGLGRVDAPIRLTAQTPGKVFLTGHSDLRMAGEYLEVSNLVFRDGWSPGGEVVSFRTSSKARANHSRVTGVVIDRYNQPDHSQADHWVALYGHDNRFDHGQIVGKTNRGTTLVVIRDEQQGLDNRHRIDHNWFGPRPSLGSNGGETIRVGTSQDSLSDSHTIVEDNWFEGCDGEVEIVSNKSGGNTYRRNVFYRSRGAMVLRHGSGNLVESNVFLGGDKPHTGGVRVINSNQTVRNNYMEGLAGDGFGSALSVMYGVPNSPINRYMQVDHAVIEHNTIVDARSVLFGAGKDDERSAAPVNSRFADNLIVGERDPVRVEGDLSGIAFSGNVQGPRASMQLGEGVQGREVRMTRADTGLLVAKELEGVGADPSLRPIPREQVGVDWYPKDVRDAGFDSGTTRNVKPGDDTLSDAVIASAAGDRLLLSAGRYTVDQVLAIDHPLSVQGPSRGDAEIVFSRPLLFDLRAGGALKLSRMLIDGRSAPDEIGNAVIRAAPGSGALHYDLIIEDSRIRNLTVNRGFDVIAAGTGTLADRIVLRRVEVDDVSGAVVSAAADREDRGTYNAERVEISDSRFRRIGGPVLDLYRGGTDESTFGPEALVRDSEFDHVGGADTPSLRLHGVQQAEVSGNRFTDSAGIRFTHSVGTPRLVASNNTFTRTPAMQADTPVERAP